MTALPPTSARLSGLPAVVVLAVVVLAMPLLSATAAHADPPCNPALGQRCDADDTTSSVEQPSNTVANPPPTPTPPPASNTAPPPAIPVAPDPEPVTPGPTGGSGGGSVDTDGPSVSYCCDGNVTVVTPDGDQSTFPASDLGTPSSVTVVPLPEGGHAVMPSDCIQVGICPIVPIADTTPTTTTTTGGAPNPSPQSSPQEPTSGESPADQTTTNPLVDSGASDTTGGIPDPTTGVGQDPLPSQGTTTHPICVPGKCSPVVGADGLPTGDLIIDNGDTGPDAVIDMDGGSDGGAVFIPGVDGAGAEGGELVDDGFGGEIYVPPGYEVIYCSGAAGDPCADLDPDSDYDCDYGGTTAGGACIVPDDDDGDGDGDGSGVPRCSPLPQPTPPDIGQAPLSQPSIQTAPNSQALVQMDIGAWDADPGATVSWSQTSTIGYRWQPAPTDDDPDAGSCAPYTVTFPGYTATVVSWTYNFSADGHDPHGADPAFGAKSSTSAGSSSQWAAMHRFRDDHVYTVSLTRTWRGAGYGMGTTTTQSDSTPFSVYEVRGGRR